MRPAAGTGSLNRAPPGIRSIAPAGSFCPSASPHLAGSALPAVLLGHQLPFTENRWLEAGSLDAAMEAVRSAYRAIPANLILATPQGPADFEILVDDLRVLRPEEGAAWLTHTNHCLHPALTDVNERFPELIESGPRKRRVDDLLGLAGAGIDVGVAQSALRDHQDEPRSICRHANDHPRHGFWTSVLSVVIEADIGRMHVSRGNPCSNPYEEYRLAFGDA